MKQLTIVRHAKSSWDMPQLEDFYRPLNPRGVTNALAMGAELQKRGVFPDLILTSPAVRAFNTAIIISRKLDFPLQRIQSNERIYEASEHTLLQVLAQVDDTIGHVMLFGHNPSLTNLINRLQPQRLDNLPTCGVYALDLPIDRWSEVQGAKATVRFTIFAKQLKA